MLAHCKRNGKRNDHTGLIGDQNWCLIWMLKLQMQFYQDPNMEEPIDQVQSKPLILQYCEWIFWCLKLTYSVLKAFNFNNFYRHILNSRNNLFGSLIPTLCLFTFHISLILAKFHLVSWWFLCIKSKIYLNRWKKSKKPNGKLIFGVLFMIL